MDISWKCEGCAGLYLFRFKLAEMSVEAMQMAMLSRQASMPTPPRAVAMPELKPMRRLTRSQIKDRQRMKSVTHLLAHLLTRFKQAFKLRGTPIQFTSPDRVQRSLQALHERIVVDRHIVAGPQARLLLRVLCKMYENLRQGPRYLCKSTCLH